MFIFIWLIVFFGILWIWIKKKFSYFKDRGIKNPPPMSFLKSLKSIITKKKHFSSSFNNMYFSYPNERYIGTYTLTTPTVLLRDPELIKLIGVKDFDYFTDHRGFSNQNDFFFSKSLMGLRGQKWRDMRSTLSPAFTGSKLRNMVPFIIECNKDFMDSLEQQINKTSEKHMDVDCHDFLTRYANDVIGTCAFGIKINSIKERDNMFYCMGKKMTTFSTVQTLKLFTLAALPFLGKFIKFNIIPKDAIDFLRYIVLNTMKERDENKVFRPDMIQLLLEARKGTLTHEHVNDEKDAGFATVEESSIGKSTVKQAWDDDYLVAQALLFFFAGFDTVSTALKFLLYELALNPDIQKTLQREIDQHHDKHQGNIGYEKINQLKYMDMVVSETLRKWPPGVTSDRECVKKYNMGKPNDSAENDFYVEKKTNIIIPIWPIHRDPEYYQNPEKFDPERFSDENKHNIKPGTYLPFGIGPRNCIGSRFALIEMKVLVYSLFHRFEVSPAPQTRIPPRLDPAYFTIRLEGGHWLRFKCRT